MQETTENPAIFIPPKAGVSEIEDAHTSWQLLAARLGLQESAQQSLASQLFEHTSFTTVFFDLDGTLLPIDTHRFLKDYALSLDAFVQTNGVETQLFWPAFNKASQEMLRPRDGFTNEDEFWAQFMHELSELYAQEGLKAPSKDSCKELLEDYYHTSFEKIGPQHPALEEAAACIKNLKAKGYRVVLATMPVFPSYAVDVRLKWAGLESADFDFITCLENQHAAKPDKAYYQGILDTLGLHADEVLMVGNNTFDDALCVRCGIPIYLLDNFLIAERGLEVSTLPHSSFKVFAQFIEELPPCQRS